MCSVMIAIEYSYKLDTKNDFNLWCELGRFLHRQSHIPHDHSFHVSCGKQLQAGQALAWQLQELGKKHI